jgi:predicted PurR-regulated permease PerM
VDLIREILATLGSYLKGQAQIILILAVLYTAGFALVPVPGWFLVGPVCALMYVVPIFGSLIGLAIAMASTLLAGQDLFRLLWVLGVWVVIQGLEGFWLSPRILGKRTRVGPLAVFFGVAVASSLFGFLGVLLAVPAMAVALVIWRHWGGGKSVTGPHESLAPRSK